VIVAAFFVGSSLCVVDFGLPSGLFELGFQGTDFCFLFENLFFSHARALLSALRGLVMDTFSGGSILLA
jgi:hypothetical protein